MICAICDVLDSIGTMIFALFVVLFPIMATLTGLLVAYILYNLILAIYFCIKKSRVKMYKRLRNSLCALLIFAVFAFLLFEMRSKSSVCYPCTPAGKAGGTEYGSAVTNKILQRVRVNLKAPKLRYNHGFKFLDSKA